MRRAGPDNLRSAALSCRLVMGMSSEIRACWSCCQAGWLEHASQRRKQKQRSLLFLKLASSKQLHVPNISQLFKNPETSRFPKCFCSLLFNSSHMIPKSYPNCFGSHLQTSPHSPHPSPVPSALGGCFLFTPQIPPLCPGISRGPPTPSLLSPLPAPQGNAFGVQQGRQQPPHPLLGCMAWQLRCQRSGGFPGGGSCPQGLRGRGRARAEPLRPCQEGMDHLRCRRTAGRFLPGMQERREGPSSWRHKDLLSHPAHSSSKHLICEVAKPG